MIALSELYAPIQIATQGTLDVAVNWGAASNNIDVYLTPEECTSIVDHLTTTRGPSRPCLVIGSAASATSKPESFTYFAVPGNYRLWIFNNGPGTESGTLEVGWTP